MRVRLILALIAMTCFVLTFGVLAGAGRSDIRVSRIPKDKLVFIGKYFDAYEIRYNPKSNAWIRITGEEKQPFIFKPAFIGKKKLPAYYVPGNMMGDPCDNTYIVLTDQSYAISISADCGSGKLDRYVSSFRLPNGVHAIRAQEKPGWKRYGTD